MNGEKNHAAPSVRSSARRRWCRDPGWSRRGRVQGLDPLEERSDGEVVAERLLVLVAGRADLLAVAGVQSGVVPHERPGCGGPASPRCAFVLAHRASRSGARTPGVVPGYSPARAAAKPLTAVGPGAWLHPRPDLCFTSFDCAAGLFLDPHLPRYADVGNLCNDSDLRIARISGRGHEPGTQVQAPALRPPITTTAAPPRAAAQVLPKERPAS